MSRTDLIRRLKRLGFAGPFSGGRHEFLIRGKHRLPIPNPHREEIRQHLLSKVLTEAGISREEWERSA